MRSFSYLVSIFAFAVVLSACKFNPQGDAYGGPSDGGPELQDEAQAREVFEAALTEVEAEQDAEAPTEPDLSFSSE